MLVIYMIPPPPQKIGLMEKFSLVGSRSVMILVLIFNRCHQSSLLLNAPREAAVIVVQLLPELNSETPNVRWSISFMGSLDRYARDKPPSMISLFLLR